MHDGIQIILIRADAPLDCRRLTGSVGMLNAGPVVVNGVPHDTGTLKFTGFDVILKFESPGEEDHVARCFFDFVGE